MDEFARIGLALKHLVHVSSCNGPEREEITRLAAELQAYEGTINELIEQRVQAAIDKISGGYGSTLDALTKRVEAIEDGNRGLANELEGLANEGGAQSEVAPAPADSVVGGQGPDTVVAAEASEAAPDLKDTLAGGAGADSVVEGDAANTLTGGQGADSIAG